jgi:hypothetical protein
MAILALIGILFNKLYRTIVIIPPALGPSFCTDPSPGWILMPYLLFNIDFNIWEDCGYEEAIYTANQLKEKTGLTR